MNKIQCPEASRMWLFHRHRLSIVQVSILPVPVACFRALLHVQFMFLLCHQVEVLCAFASTVYLMNLLVFSVCNKASLVVRQVFCPLGYVPSECN